MQRARRVELVKGSFTNRVNNLRGNNAQYSGAKLLPAVVDDLSADEIDFINGAAGNDWLIFLAGNDKVAGQVGGGRIDRATQARPFLEFLHEPSRDHYSMVSRRRRRIANRRSTICSLLDETILIAVRRFQDDLQTWTNLYRHLLRQSAQSKFFRETQTFCGIVI